MNFKMSKSEYLSRSEDYEGKCIKCGADAFGVEPDARKCECDECGEMAVYGLEELLLMGRIEIIEEKTSAEKGL